MTKARLYDSLSLVPMLMIIGSGQHWPVLPITNTFATSCQLINELSLHLHLATKSVRFMLRSLLFEALDLQRIIRECLRMGQGPLTVGLFELTSHARGVPNCCWL